jgi:hypothetical protein
MSRHFAGAASLVAMRWGYIFVPGLLNIVCGCCGHGLGLRGHVRCGDRACGMPVCVGSFVGRR